MLWLGLHLPQLPLDVYQRAHPDTAQAGLAMAICNRLTIEQANADARERGVRSGQPRATALALAPDLILRERDPARELQALQQLAAWALQFTPRLSLQPPTAQHAGAGLLLDIEASLRLFGGLQALLGRIRLGIEALGFSVGIGCAPTATAAWLFARWQDGLIARTDAQLAMKLADLPVALLASLQTRRDTVEAIGTRVFRDLAHLPRNGLARRFGKALLQEMDLALGRQPDLRAWFEAPLQFTSTLELMADVERSEALLFAARRQLCELAGWLAARHAAVRHFLIEAHHDRSHRHAPRAATRIEARFASPTSDIERMLAVLRERLAITPLPAAVHTLTLYCDDIVPARDGTRSLLPQDPATEESLGRLIERLQARLGRHQVQRILLAADHRPEAAYRIEPVEDLPRTTVPRPSSGPSSSLSSGPASGLASGLLSPMLTQVPRPLWLLHRPVALRERNQRPWWRGPLKLLCGPERIEGGWWDSHLVQRDYFIAEDDQAQWLWIYRTRGHQPAASSEEDCASDRLANWYLQGMFG